MLAIIAAMDQGRLIGANNDLPWRLPADLKRVKALTTGHTIILGRKNYESIGRPLPNRQNIVISRNPDYDAPGCTVVTSIEAALAAAESDRVFIFGGATLYEQMLDKVDTLYLTFIHERFEGDTWFPEIDWSHWEEVEREDHDPDESNRYPYSFVTCLRKPS